jgi:hypothetical protein
MSKTMLAAAALVGAVLAAPPSLAQDVERPDLSGYWLIPFTPIPPTREATPLEQQMIDELPQGTLLLADSGLREFPPGDYGGLAVKPEPAAAAANYDPDSQRAVGETCRPPSLAYAMQGPFPMEIFQGRDLIVIKMEYFDLVRVIFMNEREHPADWYDSWTGHSYGWWEGDTLVVDTNHLRSATLFNNGLDHSDKLTTRERFRLSEDGRTLVVTQELEDPETFEGRAARLIPLERSDDHVYPYDCDPTYGVSIEQRDRGE